MARGGARSGAGRPGWHVRVEDLRSIDVRQLNRDGILEAGGGVFVWRDARHCTIDFAANEITLRHDLNGLPDEQRVPILRTPCHYGGSRPWFACPTCSRRVALLYLTSSTGFACRLCAGAAYTSQVEGAMERAARKQRKVEARIGAGTLRPVGMRWATFSKLRGKLIKALGQQAVEIEKGPFP